MLVLEFYSPIAKDFMLLERVTVSWKEQQGPHRGLKMVDWASANDAKVARASTGRGGGVCLTADRAEATEGKEGLDPRIWEIQLCELKRKELE